MVLPAVAQKTVISGSTLLAFLFPIVPQLQRADAGSMDVVAAQCRGVARQL